MNLKLIGKGRTAEVFEYEGKALKLFNEGYNKDWVKYEIECQKIAQENGALVPKVYSFYEDNDRYGIIFEKIQAKTLNHFLQNDFMNVKKYAKEYAEMMLSFHKVELKDELRTIDYSERISRVKQLNDADKAKLIEYYRSLPKGNRLCHGDFHPDNVLVGDDRYVVIDWITGYIGHPGSDLCRTLLLMDTPYGRKMMPWYLRLVAGIVVNTFKKTFLEEYFKQSDITKQEIYQWMPVIAAARFLENVPHEEKWLKRIIKKRMKKL